MKIAIITYNHPHRKTQDILFRLLGLGYVDITLLTTTWEERRERNVLFSHRPSDCISIPPALLAIRFQVKCLPLKAADLSTFNRIIIGGAGILPSELVKYNIINAHPGYLPNVRGLDALKWAIHEGQPIGVTTHFIGEEADTGVLIQRGIIVPGQGETFHSIAQVQYEMEIMMLVDALEIKPNGEKLTTEYPLHKRMGIRDELRMRKKLTKWEI